MVLTSSAEIDRGPPVNNEALVLDLLEWIAARPRTHADVMRTWRTSCPRVPIWEDAVDHGFVALDGADVRLSRPGADYLSARRVPGVRSGVSR